MSSIGPLHSKIATMESNLNTVRQDLRSSSTPSSSHASLSSKLADLRKQLIQKRQRNTNLSHELLKSSLPDPPPPALGPAVATLNTLHATVLPDLHQYTLTLHQSLLSLLHTRVALHLKSYALAVSPYRSILGLPFVDTADASLTFLVYHHLLSLLSTLDPIIDFPIAEKLHITDGAELEIESTDGTRVDVMSSDGKDLLGFYIMLICTQAGLVDVGEGRDFIGNLWLLMEFCLARCANAE
jgi:hypothetical protein